MNKKFVIHSKSLTEIPLESIEYTADSRDVLANFNLSWYFNNSKVSYDIIYI